jgi:hypothetical protein
MASVYLDVYSGNGSGWKTTGYWYGISSFAPPTGYHFSQWSGPFSFANSNSSSTTVLVNAAGMARANYTINTYEITYYAGTGGLVGGAASKHDHANYGGTSSCTATANAGYHFANWSDGITNATRTYSPVTANYSVTANFAADAPVVSSLATAGGGSNGGASVVITGERFTDATSVKFGTTEATSYTVDSATQITAVSPAHAIGVVDISVTTALGTGTLASSFMYSLPAQTTTGALSPTGLIVRGITKGILSGVVAISGTLSGTGIHQPAAGTAEVRGTITITGVLTTWRPRPVTLYAPFVQTTLVAPK